MSHKGTPRVVYTVVDDSGDTIDAKFEIEGNEVILHSRGAGRNNEYSEG